MPEERWRVEKVGMGYRCWADEAGTEVWFRRIKRGKEAITGEVAVKTALDGVKTVNGIMHVSRINLIAAATRNSLAKYLSTRSNGWDLDWADALEHLAQFVMMAETEGEEIGEVGHDPITPFSEQFLMKPLIPKDRASTWFGTGMSGKSLLALAAAISVAAGREVIPGCGPSVKGPVLYLDWETTKQVINDRVQMLCAGHGFRPPKGIMYRRCVRALADDVEALSEVVKAHDVKLIVVDSAAYAMGTQGEYGDANESVLRMHEALRLMGSTALIIDHVNKQDSKEKPGTARPYGSAYKTWAARMAWEVRKGPSDDGLLRTAMYHAKSNDSPQLDPIGLEIEWHEGTARILTAEPMVEDQRQPEPVDRQRGVEPLIMELISGGASVNRADIPNYRPGVLRNTVDKAISRLKSAGRITVDDDGTIREPSTPRVVTEGMFDRRAASS